MKQVSALLLLFFIFNTSFCQEVLYYCSRPNPSAAWQVYRKDLTTGHTITITNDPNYNYWWVTLSPDQRQLLLLRSPHDGQTDQFDYARCEMVKANADGSQARVILLDNQHDWYAFGNPHWHPSGTRILLLAQSTTSEAPFYLYTIDPDGQNPQQLTFQYSLDGNWSPNGEQIVFIGLGTSHSIPLNFEVFVGDYSYESNSFTNIQQLTDDATRNHDPCFSPDGTQIVFSASNADLTHAALVAMKSNGSAPSTLLSDEGIHGGPLNWGSNGKVYYHSLYLGTSGFSISAIDTEMGTQESLLSDPTHEFISPFYARLSSTGFHSAGHKEAEFRVWYQAETTELRIQNPSHLEQSNLCIFNVDGRVMAIQNGKSGQEFKIKLPRLAPGLYFISLHEKGQLPQIRKLLITK